MAGPVIAIGSELASAAYLVTMAEMVLFEPEGEKNIHTDDEVAMAAGLPAAIAAGVQFMSYVFRMLYDEYGFESLPGTILDVRIRAPVFAGDTVTARGRVSAVEPEGDRRRLHLDVWCQNQRNEQVIAGTAEVLVA
ncbi:MAG: MaoC family dehydratase [Chloroflexi bacterium]|nr:MaoC family dehydratase [Chloroflexota bacterium]